MIKTKVKLFPFQYVGAYKLFTEERFLLADEMGMFKTSQAIFANSKFRERSPRTRTLIVCPASVREHWARELAKFAYPSGNINIIEAESAYNDVRNARDATWTILHYGLPGHLNPDLVERLVRTGFHHVILDEVHNAKNPLALRTRVVKDITDKADAVSLLSGTPIPNTMVDLYTLMSFLDPAEYPLHSEDLESLNRVRSTFLMRYMNDPQMVKVLLHKKMLARKAAQFIGDKLPAFTLEDVFVELSGKQLELYEDVLGQTLLPGKKIMPLEKLQTDPRLVVPDSRAHSAKYEALDEIVRRETRKGGKVLVFTNLKVGVIEALEERYAHYKPVIITGDVSLTGGKREHLRQQFQQDPDTRMLIATTVMNEGVDLTAANAVINLMQPWTPAEYRQRFKRAHRWGEVSHEQVRAYNIIATIPGVQPSLDIARKEMLEAKERVVHYLLSGIQLSKEELRELDDPRRVPRIMKAIRSPNVAIVDFYIRWRGIGTEKALERLKRQPDAAQYIAELYPQFVMAKNAADVYVELIDAIESQVGKLSPKLDICCGPGMLGYFLDEPTIGVDLMYEHLLKGKELYPNNKLIRGSADRLPIASGAVRFALNSLAFQMLDPKEGRSAALNEMSRVLDGQKESYAMIVLLPNYMDVSNRAALRTAIQSAGFSIDDHQTDLTKSKLEMYLLKKVCESKYQKTDLTFVGDRLQK